MKGSVLVLGQFRGREIAARIEDGVLEDLALALPEGAALAPEAICRAVVGRAVKGLGGVFVDLPGGQSGFLRQTRGLAPGAGVVVQVAGAPEPGKALPVVARLMVKGRTVILTPEAPGLNIARGIRDADARARLQALADAGMAGAAPDLGLIVRSAAEAASDAEVATELGDLRALAERLLADVKGPPELLLDAPSPHDLAWRDWAHPLPDTVEQGPDAVAALGVDAMLDALLAPRLALPGGGHMMIEPTRALVAVDVNTGPDTSPAAGLKANLAAARALPRQLRLRGLGGQVTVDFAPMPKRDRGTLEQCLTAAFRKDGGEATLAGWTPLGNFEVQRKRDRPALHALLGQ